MAEQVCFIATPGSSGEEYAARIIGQGWDVQMVDPTSESALDEIVGAAPLASVFCLEGDCGPTRQIAEALIQDARLHRPLMVFVGGSSDEIDAVKQGVPYAVFVKPEELTWVMKRLVFNG